MATHSSTLAWKIPWMEEPGRLQPVGSRGVGYDWETSLSLFTFMHWRMKWQSTSVFLPGESQGQRSLVGLPCMGWHGVRHDWSNLAAVCNCVFLECFFFLSLRGVTKLYHLILYFWMNLLLISNTGHHKHSFPKIFLAEGQWLEQIGNRQLTCQRWSFYTTS